MTSSQTRKQTVKQSSRAATAESIIMQAVGQTVSDSMYRQSIDLYTLYIYIYIYRYIGPWTEAVPLVQLSALYLHACQVMVTVGDSGLCCCTCVTYFER